MLLPAVFLVASGMVLAHGKMTSSTPADGDFVSAPSEITLVFSNKVELTGAELKSVDGSDNPLQHFTSGPAKAFTIQPAGQLDPGEYYLIWRAIASDGHFSTGEFFFTVVAN